MGAKIVKRLAILVATILVAGLSIFFIQRYQVSRMDRSVLAQAKRAEEGGNFEDAARFYQEHLEVATDDPEAKLKYADVLLKGSKDDARRQQAAQIYEQYVNRFPAEKKDVRRRLAELYVETGRYDKARQHLEILLKLEPKDGALHFMLGRCQEALNEPARAVESYRDAIKSDGPQRPEASWRLAAVLRSQLKESKGGTDRAEAEKLIIDEANGLIEEMVKANQENYQVYLERGRYYRQFGSPEERKSAKDDLQRALKMAPNDPKVYTELAALERSSKNFEEARRVIEDGLKVLPNDPTLHLERANVEMSGSSGSIDKAITSLRHSLELLPDDPMLHGNLAGFLAQRGGDPSELLKQIGELKRLNRSPVSIGFLEAKYLINCKEWKKAILSLTRLQQLVEQLPTEDLKAQVQDLLAQCYRQLGDRDRELEAYKSSIRANPKDLQAQLGLATSYAARGDLDAAIKVYLQLLDQLQQEQREAELLPIRGRLVQLLIARNQQLSVGQQNWKEVDDQIKMAKKSAPQSSGLVILETESLVAQNKIDKAQKLLEKARSQTPRDVELWVKSAEMLRRQRKFDDARKLLDQAQKALGDSVALRLERSRLLMVQGGADLPKALGAMADNTASFSPADHRHLLEELAQEATFLNDRTLVTDLWSQVAKLAPNDLEPQLRLFDLALQGKNKADIEYRLNEIKLIEGADGSNGKYEEARYTIWQAANTTDPSEQAKLRSTAQLLLNDLMSRRQVRPQVPRMLADLTLADLSQPDLSDSEKRGKQYEAAKLYLQAIELGQRDLDTIRRATDLLYVTNHNDEVIKFWTQSPNASTAGSDLLRQVSAEAFRNREYKGALEGALELAQRAKEANPDDFRETLFLVQMLIANQRQDEAEKELREAVNATPLDPARRIALVEFFTLTKQFENAEKAVLEAESALKEKPLGPARCCEVLARAYKTAGQDDKKSEAWLERAGRWYKSARSAQPKDLFVWRQYIDFLFRSGQIKTARDALENMVGTDVAEPDDRFRLASMFSKDGEWTKAYDQYGKLLKQTENPRNPEVLKRRPDYIAQFIDELLKRYQSDQRQELLNEAQDLIAELKALRPDAFNVVVLQARLFKAQNQIGKAIELIQAIAKRPDLSDPVWQLLAKLADQLGETKLAEKLLRQLVEKSDRPQNRLALAVFLGRQGRVKEALDHCEQLWNATSNPEELVKGTLDVLSFPGGDRDKTQFDRVASWMEKGLEKQPKSPLLVIGLAGIRERQGRFQDAEAVYAQGVQQGQNNATVLNNLAWLMALRKGDENKALDLINRALKLGGPIPELLDTRGVINTKLGKSKSAIEDLTKATTLDPKGPKYFHLTQAYLQAGNKQAAAESWAKARSRGLTPDGLHALEVSAYQQVLGELGTP